jgi:hypothetical protein
MQYALRSAPNVMMHELSSAFARDVVAVSVLVGVVVGPGLKDTEVY